MTEDRDALPSRTVLPPGAPAARRRRRVVRRLVVALAVQCLAGLFLAADGVDRLTGGRVDPDPSAFAFVVLYLGWPLLLALASQLLPGRGARWGGRTAAVTGMALAVLLTPLYGLGLLLLPAAGVALWATLAEQ